MHIFSSPIWDLRWQQMRNSTLKSKFGLRYAHVTQQLIRKCSSASIARKPSARIVSAPMTIRSRITERIAPSKWKKIAKKAKNTLFRVSQSNQTVQDRDIDIQEEQKNSDRCANEWDWKLSTEATQRNWRDQRGSKIYNQKVLQMANMLIDQWIRPWNK